MQHKAIMMYKIVHGLTPLYMRDMVKDQLGSNIYNLQNSKLNLKILKARTSMFRDSFAFTGASLWNALPDLSSTDWLTHLHTYQPFYFN